MTIFEVQKHDLLRLNDGRLEEFVARLCEAEAVAVGGKIGDVRRGGSGDAPDGGVDIRVAVSADGFDSGFLPRRNTVFQVKKHAMPRGKIEKEMRPNDALRPKISEQAANKGAYIIVSLKDDCAEPQLDNRRKAMRDSVSDDPNGGDLHLDFYDLSKLEQWLRQHPVVAHWVRDILGIRLSGWRPYGTWSAVPAGHDDELILAPGVEVTLPAAGSRPLSLGDAVDSVRKSVRSTGKAIRIVGLSGVGKTRFVQALFEETVGDNPLDRTIAIYADTGDDLDPSAGTMLDQLIAEDRSAVLVVDNCPSSLHATLSQKAAGKNSKVKLITVEYDIREDLPQTTEVIRIDAHGPEIAEQLILRRFPEVGQPNAGKIAGFAGGNCRIALALAERIEAGESLTHLSDDDLFNRLFWQRNKLDENFRRHAEALSLVSYFSVETDKEEGDELSVLGSLCGADRAQIHRSVSKLMKRQIAQERGRWRAVLPQAVANRLARDALENIPVETLRNAFETGKHARLLKSFAHRLRDIPDHPIARRIVPAWFADGGPLANIAGLNADEAELLYIAAPFAPDAALNKIEALIAADCFDGWKTGHDEGRGAILNLLTRFADKDDNFDRCIRLLLKAFDLEGPNDGNRAEGGIVHLFQSDVWGAHRTVGRRADVVNQSLRSRDPKRRELGRKMLSEALGGPRVLFEDSDEFGTCAPDVSYYRRYIEWRVRFIELAKEAALDPDADIADKARSALAERLHQIWPGEAAQEKPIKEKLIETAIALNEQRHWPEGFRSLCRIIHFRDAGSESGKKPVPPELADLKKRLAPTDLLSRIGLYAFGDWFELENLYEEPDDAGQRRHREKLAALAENLGEEFAKSGLPLNALAEGLSSPDDMPYRTAFGKGLAKASPDILGVWEELVALLKGKNSQNIDILKGFVWGMQETDPGLATGILDDALADPFLRRFLADLHLARPLDEAGLDRCMKALPHHDTDIRPYGDFFRRARYSGLPRDRMLKLAQMLLEQAGGACELLYALFMELRDADPEADVLGVEFRKLGLAAAAQMLREDRKNYNDFICPGADFVVCAGLKFPGNENERTALLDAVFAEVSMEFPPLDNLNAFCGTVQAVARAMPKAFLDRGFRAARCNAKARISQMIFSGGRLFFAFSLTGMQWLELGPARILTDWRGRQGDPNVWSFIAKMLIPFEGSKESEQIRLSAEAVEFLRAAPDPVAVLWAFAGSVYYPTADTMERRAEAFTPFLADSNPEISGMAREILDRAEKWVKALRERERESERQNAEAERRFE